MTSSKNGKIQSLRSLGETNYEAWRMPYQRLNVHQRKPRYIPSQRPLPSRPDASGCSKRPGRPHRPNLTVSSPLLIREIQNHHQLSHLRA